MTTIYEKSTLKRYWNLRITFKFKIDYLKTGFALGSYSICKDGKHVIYLDYDNFRYEWLKDELRFLRDKYSLSKFYIFRSSISEIGKYKHHVVCFDKVDARLYNDIVAESNADMLFKKNHFWDNENARVLRFSAKQKSKISMPVYYKSIYSCNRKRIKSLAHILFYERMFGIKIDKTNSDNTKDIRIISYGTQNI